MAGTFPYDQIADFQNWRKAVATPPAAQIDPQNAAKFTLDRTTKISSAGSCFAQRIAESLQEYGFNYHVVEPGPPWLSRTQRLEYNYGLYSARHGNIYTTLHLLQLIERALGLFEPLESVWSGRYGAFLDPFRPAIQPGGFASEAELIADRSAHLAAVKRMFAEIDVFVFTLGLTEGFCDRRDGAAFPVCPGRDAGTFDPDRYNFRNLSVAENCEYLARAIALLREINPDVRILLTVSPVPLAATIEDRHVLQSTTYSKSVLRVVAEEMRRAYDFVDYFASYEIITATFCTPEYFADDRRNVTPSGVESVMRSFYRHYAGEELATMEPVVQAADPELALDVKPCDEEELLRYINADFAEHGA